MDIEKLYSINQFAKIVGVPVSTLRFYQKNNLIHPSHKNEQNGYYYYTAKDIQKVEKLTLLRSMDVPIKMIKEILDGKQTAQGAHEILKIHCEELRDQIERLSYALGRIERILDCYNTVEGYDMPFNSFEIRNYEEREILEKNCGAHKPKDGEEWILEFSQMVQRRTLPTELPEVLRTMGMKTSLKKYRAISETIANSIFLIPDKKQRLQGWNNRVLEGGQYLVYRYDGLKMTHDEAFLKLNEYIETYDLQVDDIVLETIAENIMPIICTNMPFELQARLVNMHN